MDSDTITKRSLKSFSYQNISNLISDYTQRIIKYMYVGGILVQFYPTSKGYFSRSYTILFIKK